MNRVLESGEVEMSNIIREQRVRNLKMNLRNVGNIGSESLAADNVFGYSVIKSCRHNEIDSGKYVSSLAAENILRRRRSDRPAVVILRPKMIQNQRKVNDITNISLKINKLEMRHVLRHYNTQNIYKLV